MVKQANTYYIPVVDRIKPQYSLIYAGYCKCCQKAFIARRVKKYCSKECWRKSNPRSEEKIVRDKLRHFYKKGGGLIKHCTCKKCGKEFDSNHKKKYCSQECSHSAHGRYFGKPKPIKCAYKHCSKIFTPNRHDAKYCSKTCRSYHSHGNTTVPGWRERQKIANAPKSAIYIKTCPATGLLFTARHRGQLYHPTYEKPYIPKVRLDLVCVDCEQSFQAFKHRTHCTKCSHKEGRRVSRSARRSKIRGVYKERVIPYNVFTRDKWICQSCGIPTPKRLRGSLEPSAPEMDHIVPLAKGGDHSYINCQCLCRQCNSNKGEKIEFKYIKRLITLRKQQRVHIGT